jgi:hypothetical protein
LKKQLKIQTEKRELDEINRLKNQDAKNKMNAAKNLKNIKFNQFYLKTTKTFDNKGV